MFLCGKMRVMLSEIMLTLCNGIHFYIQVDSAVKQTRGFISGLGDF